MQRCKLVSASDPSKNGSRHSLFERIAWTYTLDPKNRNVLGALATFGSYKTGRECRPSLDKLAARCRIHPRNARKSLAEMVELGYLVEHRRTKLPTVYDICLDKLPPNTARVFIMREVMDLESDEICKELSITPTNLWVILYRARVSLRECLEQNWFATKSNRR